MVADRFLNRGFELEEALVEGGRIVAVQSDHLGPRLATANNLEGILLYSFNNGGGDRARWLAGEAEFGSRPRRTHHRRVGRCRVYRHDLYAFSLQFPAKRLAEFRQTTFNSGVG